MKLVVVESPAKAKTIQKYLGNEYRVMACYGHVRDIQTKKGGVDPEHDFTIHYVAVEKSAKYVQLLVQACKKAESLILATDPDREGEAIAWHLQHMLVEESAHKIPVARVTFNQVTKQAIVAALDQGRPVNLDLVNAQQARRVLDYLVGFNLSPLLWKKVAPKLSAGRVQSPALRLICERELKIRAFVAEEYWSLTALLTNLSDVELSWTAALHTYQGSKLESRSIEKGQQAEQMKELICQAAGGYLMVTDISQKMKKRQPSAPFTTSTLQQEASKRLGFTTKKTMMVAQQLYEGIDIGQSAAEGLITYMRTDSVQMSQEALAETREVIAAIYGVDLLADKTRFFKTKLANAQEAHEAIRPTLLARQPSSLTPYLNQDQLRLYQLIWERTIASQMRHADIEQMRIVLSAGETAIFHATGSHVVTAGFLKILHDIDDEDEKSSSQSNAAKQKLPHVEIGDRIPLQDILAEQHFTEPAPRYNEASLVKTLEEFGIGRPSTYATIISTLQQRAYVELRQRRFYPTDMGEIVSRFLTSYFDNIVDYDFTAQLENGLDDISRGEKAWKPFLQAFWQPFFELVQQIDANVKRADVTTEPLDEACPECQAPLLLRLGRGGRFIGCSAYPECHYTRSYQVDEQESGDQDTRSCPECGKALKQKASRFGLFWGCEGYPDCTHREPIQKGLPAPSTDVTCPMCHQQKLVPRKGRRGLVFYGCKGYPSCRYALWSPPIDEPCPKCQWPIRMLKTTKKHGEQKVCPQKECQYTETVDG